MYITVWPLSHLGQFMHEPQIRIFNERPGKDAEKPEASLEVKGHTLVVTRYVPSSATGG